MLPTPRLRNHATGLPFYVSMTAGDATKSYADGAIVMIQPAKYARLGSNLPYLTSITTLFLKPPDAIGLSPQQAQDQIATLLRRGHDVGPTFARRKKDLYPVF